MAKDIQVVSTDVDGTILNSNHKLPEENIEAIKKIYESGKHVVVNTGRGPLEAAEVFDIHGVKCAKICLNGAVILDENNKVVTKEIIEKTDARKIIEILESAGSGFVTFTSAGSYILPYFGDKARYKKINEEFIGFGPAFIARLEKRIEEKALIEVNCLETVLKDENIEVYKFLMFSLSSDVLDATKKALLESTDLLVTSSWVDNIEINSKSASKGNGLKQYVEGLGLMLDNAMAIGDSYNDVSMFEVAGTSVAMGERVR